MALTQPETKLSCITTSSYVHICKNKKNRTEKYQSYTHYSCPSKYICLLCSFAHYNTQKKSILFSIIMQRLSEMLQIMANYSVKKPKDVQSSFFLKNHWWIKPILSSLSSLLCKINWNLVKAVRFTFLFHLHVRMQVAHGSVTVKLAHISASFTYTFAHLQC